MPNTGTGYIAPVRIFDRDDKPISTTNRFPVDATISAVTASQQIQVRNPLNVSTDVGYFAGNQTMPVKTKAGETVAVAQSGTWDITNITGTISLPTGALQGTGNLSLSSIDGKIITCNMVVLISFGLVLMS